MSNLKTTNQLTIVNIGAFGHSGEVMGQVEQTEGVNLVALAPGHAGEDCKVYADHPACAKDLKIFDDYRQLLDEVRPDIAIISTRLDLIPEIALYAANAGCNLKSYNP